MASKRGLPPLPKSVQSALGPIPVRSVKAVKDAVGTPDEDCLGQFNSHQRVIEIVKAQARVQAHHTLRHEWAHAVFFDSGLTAVLSKLEGLEELLCDVIATALVAEMIARINTNTE